MEALLLSTGVVALAEIGDKTQLLSLVLAARFKQWLPISLGILVATLFNHALAGAVGSWLATLVGPDALRWIIGLSFIAMGAWALIPDRLDEDEHPQRRRFGVFWTTTVAFFFVEMGDKTQLATVALAAKLDALAAVVAGTTLGMLIANVPVVILGQKFASRLPVRAVHVVAAVMFAALGVLTLMGFAI